LGILLVFSAFVFKYKICLRGLQKEDPGTKAGMTMLTNLLLYATDGKIGFVQT